ncbi:TetR family transcriptional regulator [Streptomyces abyssalis]|uniref:TetR family transcriptional regulator n=1 Tax=Streptomyces abyssalis TaxID=933944 RepID=A0A1E7JFC0_9ACTN|nr:TetR/AcrR family transcriptional regulator [Streptomyces abyssalis]OEU85162.1 TetR family transcriptional regulator [Streptomyces abyssalis]OEU95583.1 TetR family transcriptional regulator [Streptomyces abyssalis]OEV29570.1 TetR family transcriptional regulator [Streptomyces nanshensis]
MQQEPGSRVADSAGDVSVRVRQVIGEAGCSQREFARRIVMDPSKLSRSLGGSRRFTVAELARIADAGRVDAAWLLGSGSGHGRSAGARAGAGGHEGFPAHDGPSAHAVPVASEGGRPLQIVRETVRLIAEHGFHAVRVSDIAEACETSTAAIHYHFPGRAELLEAAVRWCMDEDTARRAARIAEADDAADELGQLIELQIPLSAQQRRQWRVWLDLWAEAARSTAVGQLHVDYYRQWRTTVADVIRRGVEQGVFRKVDPEFAALHLTALIDGLAAQVLATAPDGKSAETMRDALVSHVATELSTERAP